MKIFVINLAHEHRRRDSIIRQLEKLDLDYTIVPAVNGNMLTEEEIEAKCNMVAVANNPEWLSRGAIGCSLSHMNVYQRIIDEDLNMAVVLEDDIVIEKMFLTSLNQIEKKIGSEEVIMLYYQSWQPLELLSKTSQSLGSCKIFQPKNINQLITTGGYVITKKVASQFLDKGLPIEVSADSWGVFHERGIVKNVRCVYPRIINVLPFKSSIEYIKSPILSKLSKAINGYRVPIIYHVLKAKRKNRMKAVQKIKFI